MELSPPRSHRWLGALAVTVAAIALTAAAESADAQTPPPLPAAGWHGRAIQHPERGASVRTQAVRNHARRGSVREVQRMLVKMGYRPGPVDGIYGVRTRSAVQWFQIKHALRPTGVVNPLTLSLIRSRGIPRAEPPAAPPRDSPPSPATAQQPEPVAVHAAQGHGVGFALVAVLVLLAAMALGLVVAALRLRRTAAPARAPGTEPAARQHRAELPRAIGFAPGRDAEEVERHAAAIQRACDARGWALARIVRDTGATPRGRALTLALDRTTAESAPLLVVDRLDHLGRSVRELAAILTWCARREIALVALDAGLDTTTPDGKAAARRLLEEVAARGSRRRRRQRPRPARIGLSSTAGHGG
jgi:hypothetical protein